ncbi:hypothetical protein, partial [Roseinatronobacter alkalisoli]
RFARSIPMMVTSDMDALSFCDVFSKHHLGTLRCRREGASMPSTKPIETVHTDATHWIVEQQRGDDGNLTLASAETLFSNLIWCRFHRRVEILKPRCEVVGVLYPRRFDLV